ncbi:MAG: undecaprenyl-diphosphate phosphatase [Candidatus Aenigmatarchaeota archaeon]
MVNLLQALILAIIQGLTEWLPISSSGHLVIAQQLFGIKASVSFNVILHFGTLLAVIYFLRRDLLKLLKFDRESRQLLAHIIIGSLPLAFFGLLLKSFFESLFSSLLAVGLALLANGTILYSTKFFRPKRKLNLLDSFAIGLAQIFSLAPGISRSGITISTALMRKLEKKEAYKFSFLLSIIAILGASLLKFGKIDFSQEPIEIVLAGILTSAIFGYIALKTIAKTVLEGNFYKFAYYCWIVGAIILLLSL